MDSVRIDKFLWAIRAYKTRSEAADACNGGKIKIAGVNAKAAKQVKAGDTIDVRKGPSLFTYRVLRPTENRVGAALVPDFAEDLTPAGEREKLRAPRETFTVIRDPGTGRPTKKDRRALDALMEELE